MGVRRRCDEPDQTDGRRSCRDTDRYGGKGLQRDETVQPMWGPDGLVGWDTIPEDGTSCGSGSVYSSVTMQCVLCPPGTAQVGSDCVPCDLGTSAPLPGMLQVCARNPSPEHETRNQSTQSWTLT